MYFATIGFVKAKIIPEKVRSTILNYFRVPLNIIVFLILDKVQQLPRKKVFLILILLVFASFISDFFFIVRNKKEKIDENIEQKNIEEI
jgi:MFS transporter, MFS domain-containing protein family, molybdate-anion transporter